MSGLRLRTPDLELRPTTEADLPAVIETLADDVGLDPNLPTYDGLDRDEARAVAVHQGYWRSLGTWTVAGWVLPFVVVAQGRVVGAQTLEGTDFLRTRTVDSASHLHPGVRGRGWGQQMRRAILALAFGPLGAKRAVTSAWPDNHASVGVSTAVGYRFTHTSEERSDDQTRIATLHHFAIGRAAWVASGQANSVQISGFEPARALFGLG